ncbi:hypothetical protein WJX73_004099 [Symbiochloris irregularis]|uniref:Uncharacterized protein n=1 Tax=Symbiochloris irregularis TaxID=706552 RepID=A0AAW1PI23_9CHLO
MARHKNRRKAEPIMGTVAVSTPELPASLQTVVDLQLAQVLEQEQKYQGTHEELSNQLTDRQILVRQVILEAPVTHPDMTHRWVGGEWLRHWADSERGIPLDDSSLLCPHGAPDPTRIPGAKQMSSSAWEKLRSSLPAATLAYSAPSDSALQPQDLACGGQKRGGARRWGPPLWRASAAPHGRLLPEASGNHAKGAVIPVPVWQHITHLRNSEPRSAPQQSGCEGQDGRSEECSPPTPHQAAAVTVVYLTRGTDNCLIPRAWLQG